MTRRLVLAMAMVAGLVAIALAIPLARSSANLVRSSFIADLQLQTLATASVLASQQQAQWPDTVAAAAARTGARVVVVDAERVLIADSSGSTLDRTFDRPEIDKALTGSLHSAVRPSVTLGADLRFVAAPVVQDYGVAAAVRLSLPESDVNAKVLRTQAALIAFVLAVVLAASGIAWLLARSIAAPLRRLSGVAEQLSTDLDARADPDAGPVEVRSVARALNRTAEQLEDLLQRTRRVAADASHHLRTPLTGVRLRLEAIEDITDDEVVRDEAIAATAEVDRLTHRIDQVLALARSDAGAIPMEPTDLCAVVRDRCAQAEVITTDRDLDLQVQAAGVAMVHCPTGMLARIADELVGNAFAYARHRVVVRVHEREGAIELVVEDDGPGVPDAELRSIFERFRRGSASVPGGSGLGLALVRESARACGGDACAERSSLGGLAVRVRWSLSD